MGFTSNATDFTGGKVADIFLSYAREDIKKAELLATALESQGWTVFWDRTSLLAGQDFEAVIEQAIKQAACMVVAWSEASKRSDWVRGEAALGRERNILVPILFEQVEPPIAFRSLHTENLVDWEGDAHAPEFLNLYEAINVCIKPGIKSSTTTATSSKPETKISKHTKTRSLKQTLKNAWDWLLVDNHQKTLALISSLAVALIAGSWQAYLHFSKDKHETKPTISASGNGIASSGNITATSTNGGNAIIATGDVTIGITLEQHEARLKRREQEVRTELAQASAEGKEKIAVLNKQLADAQAQLQNPETTLADSKNILGGAHKALDGLKQEVLPEQQIKQAQTALTKGETGKAETLFKQALDKGKGNAAEAAYQLAELAKNRIEYPTAYRYFKEAVALQPENALYLNEAGYMAYTLSYYQEAEPLYQRSLAIREKALGKDHPDVAQSLNNLAGLYHTQDQYAQAEPLYQRSLAIREKALGKDHPDVAQSLNNLAELYRTQGLYTQVEPLHQRSLAIREKALGKDHPDVAVSLNNLAELYRTQGKYPEAEPLYRRSLAIDEKALGKDHPAVATDLNNLAALYHDQGQYAQAEPLHQRSLAILEQALGKDHPTVALSINNLALLYYYQEKYTEAEPLYQHSLAILEKALGKDHPNTKTARENLTLLQARLKGGAFQVRVKAVLPNSQAEQLAIHANDILLRYNNKPILGANAFVYGRSLEPSTHPATELVIKRGNEELSFMVKPGKIGAELEELALSLKGSGNKAN